MRGYGAELIEEGRDYEEAVAVADRLVRERGLILVHSSNHPQVVAGAATLSLEVLEQEPGVDAMVLAVGGGSQAVGALPSPESGSQVFRSMVFSRPGRRPSTTPGTRAG